MKKRYNKFIVIFLVVVLVFLIVHKQRDWLPYYNYQFTKYDYLNPADSKDFIVATEGLHCAEMVGIYAVPDFMKTMLQLAFPGKNIVFRNDVKPHFIIRSEAVGGDKGNSILPKAANNCKWTAPYVIISGESYDLRARGYKRDAPPLFSFVSRDVVYSNELYYPYIVHHINNVKQAPVSDKRKFLVYISSQCIKERDKLFSLIKKLNPTAEALGKCSNTSDGKRLPGSWEDLDKIYAQYNFGFAMENKQYPGYITEKILNVFKGGAIPIYWGDSKTVEKIFNPKAYIDVSKFNSFEDAADYIVKLNNDPVALKKIQQEPMFKNNQMPDLLRVDKDSPHIQKNAQLLRKKYYDFLQKKRVTH